MIEALASRWKVIFVIGGVAGLSIFLFMPGYNTLQMSSDAKDFADTLGDDERRAIIANVCDMVFALSYGVLGVVAFKKLLPSAVALPVLASLADEVENVLVLLNIRSGSLTDGRVDLMTTVGAAKWALVGISIVLLIVLATRARRNKAS